MKKKENRFPAVKAPLFFFKNTLLNQLDIILFGYIWMYRGLFNQVPMDRYMHHFQPFAITKSSLCIHNMLLLMDR